MKDRVYRSRDHGKIHGAEFEKAGFDLHIYARTKAKVEDVIAEGVTFMTALQTA